MNGQILSGWPLKKKSSSPSAPHPKTSKKDALKRHWPTEQDMCRRMKKEGVWMKRTLVRLQSRKNKKKD